MRHLPGGHQTTPSGFRHTNCPTETKDPSHLSSDITEVDSPGNAIHHRGAVSGMVTSALFHLSFFVNKIDFAGVLPRLCSLKLLQELQLVQILPITDLLRRLGNLRETANCVLLVPLYLTPY